MNPLYRISTKAAEDLSDIWFYTCIHWSQQQADTYYRLLVANMEKAAKNFESGRVMDNVKTGYRVISVKSHLIFYRKADDGIVDIIRILHKRMDIVNRLSE